MSKRQIEVFSAGCPCCDDAVQLVQRLVGAAHVMTIRDMHASEGQQRARKLGVSRVPAVVIDGELATCCQSGPIDEEALRAHGLGDNA